MAETGFFSSTVFPAPNCDLSSHVILPPGRHVCSFNNSSLPAGSEKRYLRKTALRGEEPVIKGTVELCPSKLQASSPEQCTEYNHSAGLENSLDAERSWSVMDEEKFRRCCQFLLQQSEQLKDGWSWVAVQGSEEGYLRKTALRSVVLASSLGWDQEGGNSETEPHISCQDVEQAVPVADSIQWECEDDDDDDDDEGACMVAEDSSQMLQYEYHILYSCSYSTPVLYFRASTLEGRSLSLKEVWSSVHPNFRLRLLNSPLNTITLQEHPLLGQPFFTVHPCRTEEFMKPILQAAQDQHRTVNYVVSWLSVVGPLVGLDVSLKYSTQIHPVASGSSTVPD